MGFKIKEQSGELILLTADGKEEMAVYGDVEKFFAQEGLSPLDGNAAHALIGVLPPLPGRAWYTVVYPFSPNFAYIQFGNAAIRSSVIHSGVRQKERLSWPAQDVVFLATKAK